MEPLLLCALLIIPAGIGCYAQNNPTCPPSACGEVSNISYPFRLKDDPEGCGDSRFELTCEDNRTMLSLYGGRYQVKSINRRSYRGSVSGEMVVVDVGLRRSNCSSLPFHPLTSSNFSSEEERYSSFYYIEQSVTILSCSKQVRSPLHTSYIATEPCIDKNGYHSYAVTGAKTSDIEDSCTVTMSIPAGQSLLDFAWSAENRTISYEEVHNVMADGFNLSYWVEPRKKTFRFCFLGFRYAGKQCMPYYYCKL